MHLHTLRTAIRGLLLVVVVTLAAMPVLAQPSMTFSQIMIPISYHRCGPHLTSVFGEFGWALDQSGDGWAMAIKENRRALMVCGNGDNRNNTQLTVVITGPGNIDEEKEHLQAAMQRRVHR